MPKEPKKCPDCGKLMVTHGINEDYVCLDCLPKTIMTKEPTQGEEFDWEETFKDIKRILDTFKEDKSKLHNCASMCVKYLEQIRELESKLAAANQEIAKHEKNFQEMAMEHAAIQGALDQEIERLKTTYGVTCVDLTLAEKEIALLRGKLEEVIKWAEKTNLFGMWPIKLFNADVLDLKAILTPSRPRIKRNETIKKQRNIF